MNITLHDNIHPSAGPVHPEVRPVIGDAVRAPWVRAMHEQLQRVPRDGGHFVADVDVDVGMMRVRASRHGDAVCAVWSVAPEDKAVAASVLLRGATRRDDDDAVRAMRDAVPSLPFDHTDFAALAAEPRPSLATMYLDARWYDNARVELAATALALAAIHGPDGRLSVPGQSGSPQPSGSQVGRWCDTRQDGLKFNFTRERLQLVMRMVAKKGSAAIAGRPGAHFRVFPPRQFLEQPGVLRGRDIFDKLAETRWWVRWYDDELDPLSFGELLGFVHQVAEAEQSFTRSIGRDAAPPQRTQNISIWGAPEVGGAGERRTIRVKQTVDARQLVLDENVRRVFKMLMLEPAPLPTPLASISAHSISGQT